MDVPNAAILSSSQKVTEGIEQPGRKELWKLAGQIAAKIILIALGLAVGGVLGIIVGLFTGLIRISIRC